MDHVDAESEAFARSAEQLTDATTLEETLDAIVRAARWSIPGADYVSLSTAYPDGSLETPAATDPRVLEFDQLQTKLGEGPCVYAILNETMILSPDLARDERWPDYAREATARGIGGQLGVRLWNDEDSQAGLNVYSETVDALDQDSLHAADLFASQASLALGKARMHDQLHGAMQTRQDIGAAVGLVMAEHRLTQTQAFAHLARLSQNSNTKLRDVASALVDEYEVGLSPTHATSPERALSI